MQILALDVAIANVQLFGGSYWGNWTRWGSAILVPAVAVLYGLPVATSSAVLSGAPAAAVALFTGCVAMAVHPGDRYPG